MRKSKGERVFNVFNIIFMTILVLLTIYPFLNQLAISLSSTTGILNEGVTIFPKGFNIDTYVDIAKEKDFWLSYGNTIIYTVSGTILGLVLTTTTSFALSKKGLWGGNKVLKMIVFTMFFGGGLIPTFMLYKNLHLTGTIWAVLLPMAIVPYHLLIMKTYFEGLPSELEDAAKIDGLGQFGYFLRIVLPLSKPILATMTLFIAVLYWNDWFSALIFLNDKAQYPVTLYLRNAMMGAAMASQNGETIDATTKSVPQSIQAASMILVILPVLCIYPFVQKHFVKGVMIGAVKG